MKIFVFVGPTLSVEDARRELDAIYVPPAAQGDVYRAALEEPFAIGIIDGYFERVPAVWHKEILWAMARGIHVFGAASMGALRAAELHAFGMQGVGMIFEAFRAGTLEDDDEVAVAHGDASVQFARGSEAMVNIRATLAHGEVHERISRQTALTVEQIAKRTFYPLRSYPQLLEAAARHGVADAELSALRALFGGSRQDQKRVDALSMLRELRQCAERGERRAPASYRLAFTDAFSDLVDVAQSAPLLGSADEAAQLDVAAEARVSGAASEVRLANAWTRVFAGALARSQGRPPSAAEVRVTREALEQRFAASWLEGGPAERLAAEPLDALARRETELRLARARLAFDFENALLDELHVTSAYPRLSARAREKQAVLGAAGLLDTRPADSGVSIEEVRRWYFCERRGVAVPENLAHACVELGLTSVEALDEEALREYLYSRLKTRSG